jgi:hypothetical protein
MKNCLLLPILLLIDGVIPLGSTILGNGGKSKCFKNTNGLEEGQEVGIVTDADSCEKGI